MSCTSLRYRGDLIVLVGNVAITSGGGPVLGFCGGRQDDTDGTESLPLGPTSVQESISPCPVPGLCDDPLGQSKIGLIYVNPAGPVGATGDPVASAMDIRNIFGNMGLDDRETVSLVGGAHSFGKVLSRSADLVSADSFLSVYVSIDNIHQQSESVASEAVSDSSG